MNEEQMKYVANLMSKDIEKDKEIERLEKQNNDLRKLYQKTSKHLFDMGNVELSGYFQAQIDECPTFYVEPIIDYYKEYNRLNNIIDELEKYIRNYIDLLVNNPDMIEQGQLDILYEVLDKLKELKGDDTNG